MVTSKNIFTYGDARFRLVQPGAWKWLEDYAYITSQYALVCPPDRICDVGSGVYTKNGPLGSRESFSGATKIRVFGLGAIHVRVADSKGPCFVGITETNKMLIGLYSKPNLQDAWSSLAAAYEQWKLNRRNDMSWED